MYVHLSLSLCTEHCRLGLEKLNITLGLLPTVCRDSRVPSRALTALGSLQLGSRVCVHISKDLWYLRSLPPFYLIVHVCKLPLNFPQVYYFFYRVTWVYGKTDT